MGLYADPEVMRWNLNEYPRFSNKIPDIGKSSLRFKNVADIPLELIGKLTIKISPTQWVEIYESLLSKQALRLNNVTNRTTNVLKIQNRENY